MTAGTLWDLVDAEARHDWLDVRDQLAADERPTEYEYRDLGTGPPKRWRAGR